jgi:GNAT superfamily N-acetyltransferase
MTTTPATESVAASPVQYVEGYHPGFLGRIAELHGVYYARAWGCGAEFEGMMAQELREFLGRYRTGRDLLLTAHSGDRLVGSIAVDGSELEQAGARIRWVIVDDACRGRGIGKELVRRALDFCRGAGFARVYLWTVEGLPESFALYGREGFRIVDRLPDDRYSVLRMNLLMERSLR